MAGSCMHPGGNITGYPGYNAAGVIARALGLEPWWTPPDDPLREELRSLPLAGGSRTAAA